MIDRSHRCLHPVHLQAARKTADNSAPLNVTNFKETADIVASDSACSRRDLNASPFSVLSFMLVTYHMRISQFSYCANTVLRVHFSSSSGSQGCQISLIKIRDIFGYT